LSDEALTPLFDRLVDRDPQSRRELRPLRTLSRRDLKESVRRELERLFNTRCPLPVHRLGATERSTVDYGVPDFSTYHPANDDDRRRLAGHLRQAVMTYEPRLAEVKVVLAPDPQRPRSLRGRVEAKLVVGGVAEPVSFPTLFDSDSGEVAIDASP
jgi:type VI secretion system protein ImpF